MIAEYALRPSGVAQRILFAASLAGLLCAGPQLARAQNAAPTPLTDPTPDDDQRARELYQLGDEFYANGRYEAAEEAFAESYRLSGRPLLLFNLANAQERTGRWELALINLRTYRETAPLDERASLDARIRALERRLTERGEEARDEPVVVIQHDSVEDTTMREARPSEPTRGPIPPQRVLMPTGAGLALITLGVGLRTRSVRNGVRSRCTVVDGDRWCPSSVRDGVRRDRRLSVTADVLGLASLASLGTGLVYLIRSLSESDADDAPSFEVSAYPGGASLELRGTY